MNTHGDEQTINQSQPPVEAHKPKDKESEIDKPKDSQWMCPEEGLGIASDPFSGVTYYFYRGKVCGSGPPLEEVEESAMREHATPQSCPVGDSCPDPIAVPTLLQRTEKHSERSFFPLCIKPPNCAKICTFRHFIVRVEYADKKLGWRNVILTRIGYRKHGSDAMHWSRFGLEVTPSFDLEDTAKGEIDGAGRHFAEYECEKYRLFLSH